MTFLCDCVTYALYVWNQSYVSEGMRQQWHLNPVLNTKLQFDISYKYTEKHCWGWEGAVVSALAARQMGV